jgi:hypothetical protein
MRQRLLYGAAAFLMTMAWAALGSAQTDPLVGTWSLDVAASTFSAGAGPKSQTRTWKVDGSVDVSSVNAAGQTATYSYRIVPDGKPYPTTGAVPNGSDSVTSTRVDARTIQSRFSRGGKPADTTTFSVSADGTRLTVAAQGVQTNGKALTDRLVYTRK